MGTKLLVTLMFSALLVLSACTGGEPSVDTANMGDYDITSVPDMAGINVQGRMEERFSEEELKWIYADLRMAIADSGIDYVPLLESGRLGADNQEQGRKNAKALQGQMMINVLNTISEKYHITTLELRELLKRGYDNMWPESTRDLR